MLAMSDKHIFTTPFPVRSGRLITCLVFLLLTFPLIEQIHEDYCEHAVCAVCSGSLGSLLPASENLTTITLEPIGVVSNGATLSACQVFSRSYDGRAPPQIS
jgi:hypothetical protein